MNVSASHSSFSLLLVLGNNVLEVVEFGDHVLVHVLLSLVLDEHILEVHVGLVEVQLVDGAVQRVAEGLVVEDVVLVVTSVLGRHVGVDHHEELEGEARVGTLGQHQPVGQQEVVLGHVSGDLSVVQVAVQLVGGDGVLLEVEEVLRVADDVVLALVQLGLEEVQLEEVHPVVLKGDGVAVAIVFGSHEDLDHSVSSDVRLDLNLDVESLVVEAGLADQVRVRHVGELLLAVESGVGDVEGEVVKVGDEVVDLNVVDLDAGEFEGLPGVGLEVLLVLQEVVQDALVQLEEHGVAESGLVVLQDDGGGGVSEIRIV